MSAMDANLAVAAAFGDTTQLNAELEEKIRFFFKLAEDDNDSPALKLATVSSADKHVPRAFYCFLYRCLAGRIWCTVCNGKLAIAAFIRPSECVMCSSFLEYRGCANATLKN